MDFPVSLHAHGVLYDKKNEGASTVATGKENPSFVMHAFAEKPSFISFFAQAPSTMTAQPRATLSRPAASILTFGR